VPNLRGTATSHETLVCAQPRHARLEVRFRLRAWSWPVRRGPADAWYPSAMFDIGLQEMLVIGVIALLVFGPSKLPELGRMFGRALREFRRASDEFRSTVETNLHINDPEPIASPTPTFDEPTTAALPSEAEPQFAEPVTTPAAAPAMDVGEPYCAQRGARLFHRRECGWASRIPEVDRIYIKRVADAREQGFAECPVCAPWEPA